MGIKFKPGKKEDSRKIAELIPVYERTGFEVVQKVELQGNEFINHDEGCLLMESEITT